MPQIFPRLLVAAVIGFVWSNPLGPVARAEPPRITAITPAGVERGVTTEVVVAGANMATRPRWLGSFGAKVEPVPVPADKPGDPNAWRVRVTPEATVPVGVYLVRVQTDDGLSNAFPVAVDQVPHVAEVEDNSAFGLAQRVSGPVVVEGQASGSDVDYFRFAGRKGERVVIDAVCARIGSGVDPSLRLSTAGHRFVAGADDTPGLVTDARLFAELPADGDYVVELADTRYQGAGPRTNYRLLIGLGLPAASTVFPLGGRRGETIRVELSGGTLPGPTHVIADLALGRGPEAEPGRVAPWITTASVGLADPIPSGGWWVRDVEALPRLAISDYRESREPTDPAAPPTRVTIPAVCNGRIETPSDTDSFVVAVTPGQKVRVAVEAAALGSLLDGVLQVKGLNGAVLASDDDSALPTRAKLPPADPKKPAILSVDPEVTVAIPAGTNEITVTLRDLGGDGGPGYPYRIIVEPAPPGFAVLASTADQVNIPRGGTAALGFEVERRDFNGPITLDVLGPPPGVTVRPGLIPAGQTVGAITVSAAPDASFDASTLRIVGTADGPGGTLRSEATRTTILARQADFATHHTTRVGLPAAPSSPSPVAFTAPEAPVELVLAYAATVPVHATRSPGAEDVVLTFGSLPTVPNLAIAPDPKLGAKALDGTIVVNSNPDTTPGPVVVALTAKGKFGDPERTIALPAVTLNIVRPADILASSPRVEVYAGATADARGQIIRRGPFKEPITVKLTGLPAGLKADSVVIPPGATDFALKITADPKAAPVEADAQLTLALKLGPRDYATPPVPLKIKVVPAP